ncbi:MAG: 3-hydroxyacyl-ACP dehydratase FabZ [bacterium]
MLLDVVKIQELLPHRFPFLLVDKVLEINGMESIKAIKNVTINEWFFQGHFPGKPVMPGVLIVEAMAQTAGILALYNMTDNKGKVVYFMTIDNVKFRNLVVPGDTLRFEVKMDKFKGKIAKMHGDAFVGEDKVAEADMMAMIADK